MFILLEFAFNFFATVLFVSLTILFFYYVIKYTVSKNDLSNCKENISQVSYIPKQFLSNCEYNFLMKFIDLENELHVNIVPQVNLASVIEKKIY